MLFHLIAIIVILSNAMTPMYMLLLMGGCGVDRITGVGLEDKVAYGVVDTISVIGVSFITTIFSCTIGVAEIVGVTLTVAVGVVVLCGVGVGVGEFVLSGNIIPLGITYIFLGVGVGVEVERMRFGMLGESVTASK